MKYGTSLRVRHIVGRLEKGEELVDSIRRLCARERIRAGSFSGIGVLTSVEVHDFSTTDRNYSKGFSADTVYELSALTGNVSTLGSEVIVSASAVMSYSAFGQRCVLAGHLASAKVYAVEFTLTSYDDLKIERTYDAATGLPLWNRISGADYADVADTTAAIAPPESAPAAAPAASAEPKKAPQIIRRNAPKNEPKSEAKPEPKPEPEKEKAPAAPTPAPASAWAAAVEQVKVAEDKAKLSAPKPKSAPVFEDDDDDFEEAYIPNPNDMLEHPTLGTCRVARIEDEEWAFIKVGGTGKVRKLSLAMFDLELVNENGGRREFILHKKSPATRRRR